MDYKNKLYNSKKYSNLKELVDDSTSRFANNIAFRLKENPNEKKQYIDITYTQFAKDIASLGTALYELELQGKRIAIIGPNSYEWAISYFAILNSGSIVVPLDKGLPAQEIEYLLQRSCADAVIFAQDYQKEMLEIINSNSTSITNYICMQETNVEQFNSLYNYLKLGNDLLQKGDKRYENTKIDNMGMSIILFTSGTTSDRKSVV